MRHRTTPIRTPKGASLVLAPLLCGLLAQPFSAVAAAAEAVKGQILPGKSVGSINLGMSEPDVVRAWGPPERTEQSPDGVALYDYGEKQGVGIFVAGNRVAQIMVVTQDWTTTNGIKVGATRPEVLAFYGRPDAEFKGENRDEYRFWYKRQGIVFTFKDRAVAGITVVPVEGEEGPRGGPPSDDPAVRKPFLPTPKPQ
jgi:hypothetical protein